MDMDMDTDIEMGMGMGLYYIILLAKWIPVSPAVGNHLNFLLQFALIHENPFISN